MKARYRVNVAKSDTPQTFDVVDTDTGEVVQTFATFKRALAAAAKRNPVNPLALESLATTKGRR